MGADVQSGLSADLGHDEGRDLSCRAAVHLHGLHDRAGRPHGAAVRGPAQPSRAGARLALSGGHPDGDDLRHGDRHRRRRRDRARHHGRADDDQDGLRRPTVGGCHRRRRYARHSDPAQRHAGGDGPGHGRARQPALFGSVRSRLPARRLLRRLHAHPQLHQSEARSSHDDGRAQVRLWRDDHGEGGRARRRVGCRLPGGDDLPARGLVVEPGGRPASSCRHRSVRRFGHRIGAGVAGGVPLLPQRLLPRRRAGHRAAERADRIYAGNHRRWLGDADRGRLVRRLRCRPAGAPLWPARA